MAKPADNPFADCLSQEQLRVELQRLMQVSGAQSITEFAGKLNSTRSFMGQMLDGSRGIGDKMLKTLGYERVPCYRKAKK